MVGNEIELKTKQNCRFSHFILLAIAVNEKCGSFVDGMSKYKIEIKRHESKSAVASLFVAEHLAHLCRVAGELNGAVGTDRAG